MRKVSPTLVRRLSVAWALVVGGMFLLVFATPPAGAQQAGILDQIQGVFGQNTAPLLTEAATWSLRIFSTLAIFEFIWTVYDAQRSSSWTQFFDTLTFRLVLYGLGLWLCQNQIAISQFGLTEVGQIAGGFAATPGMAALNVDAINDIGLNISVGIFNATPANFAAQALAFIPQFLSAITVQVAFTLVAIEALLVQIATQFLVPVGSVLVGFVATRWTRPISGLWGRMWVSVLMLNITVAAIAGVGVRMGTYFAGQMQGLQGTQLMPALATMCSASIVFLFMAMGLTGLAAFLSAQVPLAGAQAAINTALNAGSLAASAANASGEAAAAARSRESIAALHAATRLD
jgi:hypothetical protein